MPSQIKVQHLWATVDDVDYARLASQEWAIEFWGSLIYAKSKRGLMHRLILNDKHNRIEHKDGNGLNNCRDNLILVPIQMTVRRFLTKKQGFRGVTFQKSSSNYKAQIVIDYQNRYLGVFDNPEDAARAYDHAAKLAFGDQAVLNFPEDDLEPERRSKRSSSNYKGVSQRKGSNSWRSQIVIRGRVEHIGTFKTEIEAAKAYDEWALRIFGPSTKLNFPEKVCIAV